ncbi:MAG: lipopolysaccharide biosynthesis protein [Ruminococcus sp.]|nr:lipopolysaccharide biosynthesis protein [Ruminococcus sp.]
MRIKKFILNDKNVIKESYIWNTIASMLMAFQSVIMLMILTRVMSLEDAGIFTIAYANANLFLTVGKYGMRNFQVSDVQGQFVFQEYRTSRVITVAAMLAVSSGYVLYSSFCNTYSMEKTQIFIWMCLFKAIDAMEDVYHGCYQQHNRLDLAARSLAIRLILTILVFGISLVVSHNLLFSLIFATCVTLGLFYIFTKWTCEVFLIKKKRIVWNHHLILLIKQCFPLFCSSFFSFYIGNAMKYAIDAKLTDEMQACYGFISMPVFVIGLLNNFIFSPMLYKMSILWDERKIKIFVEKVLRQIVILAMITLICLLGAYILGVPVLSWLYNTDLFPFKKELLILLLGGGFLGLSGFLSILLTIIRYQNLLMWGYLAVAVLAYFLSDRTVELYGMTGASILYVILMLLLCVMFLVMFVFGILRNRDD